MTAPTPSGGKPTTIFDDSDGGRFVDDDGNEVDSDYGPPDKRMPSTSAEFLRATNELTSNWSHEELIVSLAGKSEVIDSLLAQYSDLEKRLDAASAALLAARRGEASLRDALRDVVDAYDWWQVDPTDREASAEAMQAARAVRCEGERDIARDALEGIRSDIARHARLDDPAMVLVSIEIAARDALEALDR